MPYPFGDKSAPVFKAMEGSLLEAFEKKFTALLGKFILCDNTAILRDRLHLLIKENSWQNICCEPNALRELLLDSAYPYKFSSDLMQIDVALTDCTNLVAKTGTIVLSANQAAGRSMSAYAPVHIVVATEQQLVFDLEESIDAVLNGGIDGLPSAITFASGPSRTGDIEKTLVVGVHGPREVYVFLLKTNPASV